MIKAHLDIQDNGSFKVDAALKLQMVTTKVEGAVTLEGNTNDICSDVMSGNEEVIWNEIFGSLFGLRPEQVEQIKKSVQEDRIKDIKKSLQDLKK